MQKKFILNLILLLFLNLFIKPFWILGIDRAVQNAVGAADYGIYFTLFNVSFLFNILLDLGITNFNNKNIAQNNHLLDKHFPKLLTLKLFLSFIYISITLVAAWILRYDPNQTKFLFILAINQFLISLILYLRSNISALHLFKTDSFLSVLDRFVMIIICSLLLWTTIFNIPITILAFAYAQTVSYIITVIIALYIVYKKAKFTRLSWDQKFNIIIIRASLPYAILVLLMTFYNRIDSIMLERLLTNGAIQAGIYAQAYRLLDAVNMIAYLFSVILLPMFSKMISQKESVEELAKLSFKLISVPAIVCAIGSIFFSNEIMGLLYHNNLHESSLVYSILMLCFIATSTTYVYGTLLTANGNLKYLNMMALAGMCFNIIVNLVLIPKYGVIGAAISGVATQVITAGTQYVLAHKVFKYKFDLRLFYTIIAFIAGVILINVIISHIMTTPWLFNFWLMMILSLVLAIILKLYDYNLFLSLFSKANTIKD